MENNLKLQFSSKHFFSKLFALTSLLISTSFIYGEINSISEQSQSNTVNISNILSSSNVSTADREIDLTLQQDKQRENNTLMLIHHHDRTIKRLYTSPNSIDDWEEDILNKYYHY